MTGGRAQAAGQPGVAQQAVDRPSPGGRIERRDEHPVGAGRRSGRDCPPAAEAMTGLPSAIASSSDWDSPSIREGSSTRSSSS